MVRSVRSCQQCQKRFIARGGAVVCTACDRRRRRRPSLCPTTTSTTMFSPTTPLEPSLEGKRLSATFDKHVEKASPHEINNDNNINESIEQNDDEDAASEGGDDFLCTQLEELDSGINVAPRDTKAHKPTISSSEIVMTSTTTFTHSSGEDICFICGANLSDMKHRINHIKRCSKKHAISGKDIRGDDHPTTALSPNAACTKRGKSASASDDPPEIPINNPYTKKSDWHGDANALLELSNQNTSTNITNQATRAGTEQPSKQTSLATFFIAPARNLNNVLMAASRRLSKEKAVISEAAQLQKKRVIEENSLNNVTKRGRFTRRQSSRMKYSNFSCPQYKKIPGTDFVVDGFHYAKESLSKNYFLTHFHSDHYGGIDSTWHEGTIFCSLPTANLVNQQLGVDKKYLHPIPMNTATIVASRGKPITVTLLDANHCPGAVMFLFEFGGKRRILHVGDFRWNREVMLTQHPLRQIASKQTELDELFLDTTYCDPKYTLPSQSDTVSAVMELFQRQKAEGKRTLHLFGAYTIGKERIFLSVAERFGMKVYVDCSRYRVLSALEWPKDRMRLLTTNKEESCIWVIPLGHINMKKMPDYFRLANSKPFAPAYDQIVGYRPTGWSLSSKPSAGIVSTRKSGNITIHSLPYSEHSSFPELVDCLACLRPAKIVPTVNAAKSQEQVEILLKGLRTKQTEIRFGSLQSKTS